MTSIHAKSLHVGLRRLASIAWRIHSPVCFQASQIQRYSPATDVPLDEETLSTYNPADYYPVRIGDVLHDKYTVVVKLGYGRSSTTWLAQDRQ